MLEDEEQAPQFECSRCNESVDEAEVFMSYEGDVLCDNCSVICDGCSDTYSTDESFYDVDGYNWCENCTQNDAHYCDGCCEYTRQDTYWVEDRSESWCEHCVSDCEYCDDCNEYYADGCTSCENVRTIHDYSYRPDPIFHQSEGETSRLFFGIEVEMESPGGSWNIRNNASEYASAILEANNLAYLKSDGSIECGFELVTHPMTYSYYKNDADKLWEVMEKLRSEHQMKAWDARTCGLHIHISRAGFSGGAHMHRFLNLIYSNQRFYETLAGRSSSRWAKFDDVIKADENGKVSKSFKLKLDNSRDSDRYSAVNTQNRSTLEIRIFRSSVNQRVIRAQIGLAHASVEYTRTLTVKEVRDGALDYNKFVQYIMDNREMYAELADRVEKYFQVTATV